MDGVRWVKLDTSVFNNPKIKKLMRMPNGHTTVLIYFNLLTLAGRQGGDGRLMLTEGMPFDMEDLAGETGFELDDMRLAMTQFQRLGMVDQMEDGGFRIAGWAEHQAVGGSTSANAERQRRFRERKKAEKALPPAEVTPSNAEGVTVCVTHNVTDNALEIEKEIEKENKKTHCAEKALCAEVIEYLNAKTGKRFRTTNKQALGLIRARLAEGYALDDFKAVIDFKCSEWLHDAERSQYLQPSTLFAPSHFDQYLANAQAAPARAAPVLPRGYAGADVVWDNREVAGC